MSSSKENIVPVLSYNEPQNFYRGASKSPIDYSSSEVNCLIQVYPFRPYTGNIEATFRQTLLRDWIQSTHRENALAGPPVIGQNQMPGADRVIDARFQEALVGTVNERMRILIVAGNRAALVDVSANSAFSWNKALPRIQAMLATLHVDRQPGPPSVSDGPGPGGAALAGLFGGTKMKYQVNLNRPVGYGDTVVAQHFYLFSPQGRVFRCYGSIPAGGDWRRFDFDTSERKDPVNTGRFKVRGNQLYIQMAAQPNEPITAAIVDNNALQIESVKYARMQ
jgi:hypothetical protein